MPDKNNGAEISLVSVESLSVALDFVCSIFASALLGPNVCKRYPSVRLPELFHPHSLFPLYFRGNLRGTSSGYLLGTYSDSNSGLRDACVPLTFLQP